MEALRPHVLVLDDDADVRRVLVDYLEGHEFRVSAVARGADMFEVLDRDRVELLLLDLRLPGEDGLDLARRARARFTAPIVIMSGQAAESDRVAGLEGVADDYVIKPFSPRELLARIRALLRRTQGSSNVAASPGGVEVKAYRFNDWELNLGERRLTTAEGTLIPLTNSEFSLLCAFLSGPQRVLSREQLLERSRLHSLEVFDRTIDVTILRLRRKIEVDPSNPTVLTTQRGAGYVFNSPVSVLR